MSSISAPLSKRILVHFRTIHSTYTVMTATLVQSSLHQVICQGQICHLQCQAVGIRALLRGLGDVHIQFICFGRCSCAMRFLVRRSCAVHFCVALLYGALAGCLCTVPLCCVFIHRVHALILLYSSLIPLSGTNTLRLCNNLV